MSVVTIKLMCGPSGIEARANSRCASKAGVRNSRLTFATVTALLEGGSTSGAVPTRSVLRSRPQGCRKPNGTPCPRLAAYSGNVKPRRVQTCTPRTSRTPGERRLLGSPLHAGVSASHRWFAEWREWEGDSEAHRRDPGVPLGPYGCRGSAARDAQTTNPQPRAAEPRTSRHRATTRLVRPCSPRSDRWPSA